MLVLLPPSETKRDGGSGGPLDLAPLAYPRLTPLRRGLLEALSELALDREATISALGLGPRQWEEIDRNRTVMSSATMPALDRYTGVLYDALDAPTLTTDEREFAAKHVAVHSALFGPIAALDAIPAYRLSHNSRLPSMSIRKHWAGSVADELSSVPGLILDLRSTAYVSLGPAPTRSESVYLRVVAHGADGRRRPLNHFNKASKGHFTRALTRNGQDFGSAAELISWAGSAGFTLAPGAPGELDLVIDEAAPIARH